MKSNLKITLVFIIGILLIYAFLSNREAWMLSGYRDGATVARFPYDTKSECLSAGNIYLTQGSLDRFDCGLNCKDFDMGNFKDSPICEQVCDSSSCR